MHVYKIRLLLYTGVDNESKELLEHKIQKLSPTTLKLDSWKDLIKI
jgi:hypothetical protein